MAPNDETEHENIKRKYISSAVVFILFFCRITLLAIITFHLSW